MKINKYRAVLVLCVLSLVVAGAFRFRVSTSGMQTQAAQSQSVSPGELPEHKLYEFWFHHVVRFKNRANATGKPEARDTQFQQDAGLSDNQIQALEQIATTCVQQADAQDAEASAVIKAYRAKYFPNGKVPQGQKLPPPPQELKAMQQRRNAIFLSGRDQLMASLGEEAFKRFDASVKWRLTGRKVR